jgi:hypothetical protein
MRSFNVTRCARRDLRIGGSSRYLTWLKHERNRRARRAVARALRSSSDHDSWDGRLRVAPASGWDVI